jgi:hypothetical protein
MTKIIFMKELLDTLGKEKVNELLKIGEVKLDEKEVPYISVDAEPYLESNINLHE